MTTLKLMSGAAIAATISAFAVASAGSPAESFNKADADSNGTVSQAEYVAYKTADGKVSTAEAEAKFAKLAGDDAQLTLAEVEAAVKSKRKHDCKDKKMEQST